MNIYLKLYNIEIYCINMCCIFVYKEIVEIYILHIIT